MFLPSSNKLPKTPILVPTLAMLVCLLSATAVLSQGGEGDLGRYIVHGVTDKFQRTEIAGTGVAIDAIGSDWVEISAVSEEIAAVEALGYQVEPIRPPARIQEFPLDHVTTPYHL
jgi:hypothetical protein